MSNYGSYSGSVGPDVALTTCAVGQGTARLRYLSLAPQEGHTLSFVATSVRHRGQ